MAGNNAGYVAIIAAISIILWIMVQTLGPPPSQTVSWGPLALSQGSENEFVAIRDAYYTINQSGVYLTVKFTVKKEAWIDAIYYNVPLWMTAIKGSYDAQQALRYLNAHAHKIELDKWYKPGTYTVTIKYTNNYVSFDADVLPDGRYYIPIQVPVKPDGSKWETMYYIVEDVKSTNWTITRFVVAYTKTTFKGVEVLYLEPGPVKPWMWWGTRLGWITIRAKPLSQAVADYVRGLNTTDPEELGRAVQDYLRMLFSNGLSVKPEQVIGAYWARYYSPKEPPPIQNESAVVLAPGDCPLGTRHSFYCLRMPVLLYNSIEAALRGGTVEVEIHVYDHRVVAEGRIGDTPVYIVNTTETIVKVTTKTIRTTKHSSLYAIVGAKPPEDTNTWAPVGLQWFRVMISAKETPYSNPVLASMPVHPALPPPSKTIK